VTAFPSLQDGLAAATAGDEIWVAAGTYAATATAKFVLKNGVALYGGFAGTETELAQRDWARNVTTLDGAALGSTATIAADSDARTRLDGFVVRNGKAEKGGGVHCLRSAAWIANNTITENQAFVAGSGIYCEESMLVISNNAVVANPTPANGVFGSGFGGGINCTGGAPLIANNRLVWNSAFAGGAILCDRSAPTIQGNLVLANLAESIGGGIESLDASPLIQNNRLIGNMVWQRNSLGGGALSCSKNSSPKIIGNLILDNAVAGRTPTFGGGGLLVLEGASPSLHNNAFVRNRSAGGAGGIHSVSTGIVLLVNNVVALNSSGLQTTDPATVLRRNCFFGNGANDFVLPSGAPDPTANGLNLTVDPLLIENQLFADLRLHPNSPCRDAGDSSVVQPDSLDLDGQPRVQGPSVDIGADETDGVATGFDPRQVRVRTTGDDRNDGSSWALAKRTIQAATDTLAAGGGEVWVAGGTYTERNRLRPFVYLYGGFRGDETRVESRDWQANSTILDGQQAGSVVTFEWVDNFSALDGFVVRNGKAERGGGILCRYSSVGIRNNTILDNTAVQGGGLALLDFSSAIVERNRFIYNSAVYEPVLTGGRGGGLYLGRQPALLANNLFLSNSASSSVVQPLAIYGAGAAIYADIVSTNPPSGTRRPELGNETIIVNNTLLRNMARASDGVTTQETGGSIQFLANRTRVANNIVAFGTSGITVSGMALRSGYLVNNCVFGNGANYVFISDQTGVGGNISVDPLLVDAATDFHLRSDSPCLDAGDDGRVQAGWLDLDGEPRTQGAHVDIGADEFTPVTPGAGSFEGWIAAHFTGQTDPAVIGVAADPDRDGLPNLVEFAFGLDPALAQSGFTGLRASVDPAAPTVLTLEFTRPAGRIGLSYLLESSPDLVTWAPLSATPQTLDLGGGQEKVVVRDTEVLAAQQQRFLRLSVKKD